MQSIRFSSLPAFLRSLKVLLRCQSRQLLACLAVLGLLFLLTPKMLKDPEPDDHGHKDLHRFARTITDDNDGSNSQAAQRRVYFQELKRIHKREEDGAIEAFQGDRRRLIQQGCQKRRPIARLPRHERKILLQQILVNDRYHFLYCFTPKVACSNWKKVLMALDEKGLRPENITKVNHAKDVRPLRSYSDREISHRLATYYKFMFVREPMARLASAFLNKFREIPAYMKKYGVPIVKRYRKNPPADPKGDDVTWSEFVQYLMDTPRTHYNQHWMPYHNLCQPCSLQYDFIGSYENLQSEANYVIRKVGAANRVAFPPRQSYYKPLKSEQLQQMLDGMVPSQLQHLTALYAEDFKLFGYSVPSPRNKPHHLRRDTNSNSDKD